MKAAILGFDIILLQIMSTRAKAVRLADDVSALLINLFLFVTLTLLLQSRAVCGRAIPPTVEDKQRQLTSSDGLFQSNQSGQVAGELICD